MKWIILLTLFTGCVSLSQNKRDEREAYIRGLQKARKIAHIYHCDDAVFSISAKIDVEDMKP